MYWTKWNVDQISASSKHLIYLIYLNIICRFGMVSNIIWLKKKFPHSYNRCECHFYRLLIIIIIIIITL